MLSTIVVAGKDTPVMPVHVISTRVLLVLKLSSFLKFTADGVNWSASSSNRLNP